MDLAVAVHRIAEHLPPSHRYELGSQVRKAVTSVPSNVAEGHAHRGERTFLRHIRIALGSLAEVETQLELAIRLQFLKREDTKSIEALIGRTGKLLHGLERSLKSRIQSVVITSGLVLALVAVAFA
jgi:four helix bundle protein